MTTNNWSPVILYLQISDVYIKSSLRVKCCVDVNYCDVFQSVHSHMKVFELLEINLHNFQPSVNTISQLTS